MNGANVNLRDQRGQGALHAAATAGHTGYNTHTHTLTLTIRSNSHKYSQLLFIGCRSQVCLLLKRGANQYAVDERGQDPLAIAVETAHADIVTL